MNRTLLPLLFLITTLSAFCQNKDVEALTQLNKSWIASYPAKDAATLNKIIANDFIMITGNGAKMTKQDIIGNLSKQTIISANIDSVHVRLLTSDAGLVTGYVTFELMADGKKITGRNCYQDAYVKRNDAWVAVAAHVTNLNMK